MRSQLRKLIAGPRPAAWLAAAGVLLIAGAADLVWQANRLQGAPLMLRGLAIILLGLCASVLALIMLERRRRASEAALEGSQQRLASALVEAADARQAEATAEAKFRTIANSMPAVVADLEARQAHLQSILDSAPAAMIVTDEHGIIQSFSASAVKQFGWAAADAIGADVGILTPEGATAAEAGLTDYLRSGDGKGRVLTGRRRDGSTFPMELSVGEMRSSDRRYFTAFVRDLTEQQQAEERYQLVQSELAHVSRLSAMGEMASALAHELNQPLSATASYVQGSLRLLDSKPIDANLIKEALAIAGEQMLRAGDIIRRLRDFVSKGETERRIENLPGLLEESAGLALVVAKQQDVTLSLEIEPDLPRVLVDKVQVQQVALNLMRNAIEAMADQPVRQLTISARRAAGDMVLVTVADTGCGIGEQVITRLFEPFVTTKQTGMGVGLSISRTIVEAHGGRIWAEARRGGGTVFNFTLRAVDEEALADGDG